MYDDIKQNGMGAMMKVRPAPGHAAEDMGLEDGPGSRGGVGRG